MLTLKDVEISKQFDSNYGVGLEYICNGEAFITTYEGEIPRKVILDVTSWKGMTAGAMHFYGEIVLASLKVRNVKTGDIVNSSANTPQEAKRTKIQLTRKLTKNDLLLDRGKRFTGGRIGESINNFDSKQDVQQAAIQFFEKHFPKDWRLIMLDPVTTSMIAGSVVINEERVICG